MAGEVKLPAVGPVSKKTLWLGGGAAAVVMALLWWRKRNTAAASPIVDSGTDPNALDSGGPDIAGGGGPVAGPTLPTVANPVSNPQWTALVMQQLGGVDDPSALSAALGRYLTGGAVTPDQESLIDQAIAAAGYPPVAGPNGYPPGIRTQPSGGQTPPPPPPPPVPAPGGNPPPKPTAVYHDVVHGDTLDSIARPWGTTAGAVYARNAGDIEYQAHIHGHPSSRGGPRNTLGWWIFPGTRLYKP